VFILIAGLSVALVRISRVKFLRFLAAVYIDVIRGIPLLVQIFMVYFGLPQLLSSFQNFLIDQFAIQQIWESTHIEPWPAAIISTSLNSGAYIGEIFRAGVQSIERGQMEAARSLGMTHVQAMRYVILPQAFRRVIPPLGNEFIAMLKDTSLLSVIGFEEMARRGQLIVSFSYKPFHIWTTVALIYLIMTLGISRFVDFLERRLRTSDDHR
ncbi:MAG: amino acid ABC transporter permease, partial [Syntrophomonadaceae bacterium]|nr:amino acid ABC transporter permease [Syntrophomonadaceae bacterium]